jgi:hypothetical protein
LPDTIEAVIISHLSAPTSCGTFAAASLTILLTHNADTIRVIDLCNRDEYEEGVTVRIVPKDLPPFDVITPFTLTENPLTGKGEPSWFDIKVLKTTWGTITEWR